MAGIPKLGRAATKRVEKAVNELFERLKARLLGPHMTDHRIIVTYDHTPELSLPGIFSAAAKEEGYVPDTRILDAALEIADKYIDAQKERCKAQTINAVNAWIANNATGKVTADEINTVLGGALADVYKDISTGVHKIVDTEASNIKNVSLMDGIVKVNATAGINDPVVYFVVVRDVDLCKECVRLHLLDDEITPRVYKLSEVGHGYHKKGEPDPKIGGLHPHCRCTLVTLLPGYGFDKEGMVTYISKDHDEYAKQHSLERSETPEEFEDLLKNWKAVAAAAALALTPAMTAMDGAPVKSAVANVGPVAKVKDELNLHLRHISQLETSGGKFLTHKAHSKGIFHTAVGAVGLKPVTAHEHYIKDAGLQKRFPGLHDHQKFLTALKTNKRFYNAMANHVWGHLVKRTGSPIKAAYGWRHGRGAALRAEFHEVKSDPYVAKFASLAGIAKTEEPISCLLNMKGYDVIYEGDILDDLVKHVEYGEPLEKAAKVGSISQTDFIARILTPFGWEANDPNDHFTYKHKISGLTWRGFQHNQPNLDSHKHQYYMGQIGIEPVLLYGKLHYALKPGTPHEATYRGMGLKDKHQLAAAIESQRTASREQANREREARKKLGAGASPFPGPVENQLPVAALQYGVPETMLASDPSWVFRADKAHAAIKDGKYDAVPKITAMDAGDGTYLVDEGNETLHAAKRHGHTHVPVEIIA